MWAIKQLLRIFSLQLTVFLKIQFEVTMTYFSLAFKSSTTVVITNCLKNYGLHRKIFQINTALYCIYYQNGSMVFPAKIGCLLVN